MGPRWLPPPFINATEFQWILYVFLRETKKDKYLNIFPHVDSTDNRTWDWSVMKNNVGVLTGLCW